MLSGGSMIVVARWRTLALWTALLLVGIPSTAFASYTSTVAGTIATMVGDASPDNLTITQAGGLFRHNRQTLGDPGFNSDFDFDTTVAGDQTVSATTGTININAGDGGD